MILLTAALVLQAPAGVPRTIADLPCPPMPVVDPARTRMLVTPQPQPIRLPPASQADRERFVAWNDLDPAGLCRYRAENAALPPATDRRVVFIGDSITEAWIVAAPALFSGDVLDRGVSGHTTTQMLSRFRDDVIALKPSVVHIMGGVNDAYRPWGMAVARQNISSMVELARANGIAVVLGAATPASGASGAAIAGFNAWLRGHAAREGIAFVDYHGAISEGAGGIRAGWSNDALHPNQHGYDAMTPLAAAAIAAALKQR